MSRGFERFAGRAAALFLGRWARAVTIALWLAAAVGLSLVLPSVTRMETPNPATLPRSAPSEIAGRLEAAAFGHGNTLPGLFVFHRPGGLTGRDLKDVAGWLSSLTRHPLPDQIGAPALANVPIPALAAAVHNGTLTVPVVFRQDGSATVLARLKTQIGLRFEAAFHHNLLAQSTAGSRLSARFTGPEGIAMDTSALFKHADVTLLAGTTILILVLLVLIYRSPVLPWVPLVGVGMAYLVTQAILGLLAHLHVLVVDAETVSIMTVLMFGAGTDYTLLVVARYREELHRESDARLALIRSVTASAGTVLMSAATVMAALLVLYLARYGPLHRFAVPFALGVGMTALASLTLIPGVLAIVGRIAFWPVIPIPHSARPPRTTFIARAIGRRPLAVAGGGLLLLAVLATFSLGIRPSYSLLSALPSSSQARQGYALLARAEGPGALAPVSVLVEGSGASQNIRGTLQKSPGVRSVSRAAYARVRGRAVARYEVILSRNPLSTAAMNDLALLKARARHALAAGSARVYLAGETAQNLDTRTITRRDERVVIPLVLVLIALLLMAYLRSVVAALYLIATVVLSFFASLGLGWLILHQVLGIGGLASGVVLYAFVFLVALGEDYNLFMTSRIWRARRTAPMAAAVQEGMAATGGVITAAGLILAGTFAVLTGLPLQILLEFGVVAALGVLVDTFIVRSAVVPAITAYLGDKALWPARGAAWPVDEPPKRAIRT
ncbi:MAG: MMPL family transporter [Clostridia bacterium]